MCHPRAWDVGKISKRGQWEVWFGDIILKLFSAKPVFLVQHSSLVKKKNQLSDHSYPKQFVQVKEEFAINFKKTFFFLFSFEVYDIHLFVTICADFWVCAP